MLRFSIFLILTTLIIGCTTGREIGRFVEATIITVPQKVSPVGSPSRGAQLVKVYPSGEYSIYRDRRYIGVDGFSTLSVAQEYTEGSTDYSVLTGTTHDGQKKSIIFVSLTNVHDSGILEIPWTSSRPFEVQKSGSTLRFIQESDSGKAYIVSSIDSASAKKMNTVIVPKADVKSALGGLEPAQTPYFDIPATKQTKSPGATTPPAKEPSKSAASVKNAAYGIELPPLDAYTSVKVDRTGKAKVDTTSAPNSSKSKPQLVLD